MTIEATDPIKFGEFTPDQGEFNNKGGSLMIRNSVPYGDIYKPFADLASITDALGSKCYGAFSYRDAAGNVTIFAGTATKLYKLVGTSWTDITRTVGGDYATTTDNFWDFCNFGSLVIATNYADDIQVYDVGTSTNFAQLSSTAPKCRRMAVVSNFLACVDTVDGDGAIGYRVRWSPIGNPAGVWGSILATQTDYQDITGGDYSNSYITQLDQYGLIVQGRGLVRMDYVGGDTIFDFSQIDKGRGSLLPRSCITNGKSVFYIGEDGFYEYNGTEQVYIGDGKVDKYFFALLDQAYDFNISPAIDPLNKMVWWSFPSIGATGGNPDMMIGFNWENRRWSIVDQAADCIFSYISTALDMDSLDALYPSVDAMPFSLDSRIFTGGKTALGGFTSAHALGLFTGTNKTATLQSSEVRINRNGRSVVSSVIPYIEGTGTITGRLGTRNLMSESVAWTSYISLNPYTGELDFLSDSAFSRVELTLAGNWTLANSFAFRASPSGMA